MAGDLRDETQALSSYLRLCIQARRRTIKSVEAELFMGEGYLGQLLRGSVDLKVKHVFAILAVLEMEPAEFFTGLYGAPGAGTPPRPVEALQRRRGRARPRRPPGRLKPEVADKLYTVIEQTFLEILDWDTPLPEEDELFEPEPEPELEPEPEPQRPKRKRRKPS